MARRFVFGCCKSAQAFFKEVNPQRINAAKQNINSEVELELINKQWFMQVSLHDVMILWIEIFEVSSNENTSTLTRGFRLGNKSFAVLLLLFLFGLIAELLFEVSKLCWQEPCLREELILFWKNFLKTV